MQAERLVQDALVAEAGAAEGNRQLWRLGLRLWPGCPHPRSWDRCSVLSLWVCQPTFSLSLGPSSETLCGPSADWHSYKNNVHLAALVFSVFSLCVNQSRTEPQSGPTLIALRASHSLVDWPRWEDLRCLTSAAVFRLTEALPATTFALWGWQNR